VVDDDVSIVELFRMALQAEDYDVETVFTGEQALDALKGTKFDLVIIDIMLPDIRGDRVVEKIREKKRIDVLKLGISEILLKPIKLNELIMQVKTVLEKPIFRLGDVNAWFESRKWAMRDYAES
jgi:DNA-binding response OmpR family regulator